MSDNQTVWSVLWRHANALPTPGAPFEIDDVVPAVASALKLDPDNARRKVGTLLVELSRLPEGRQYFAREGNAVVPLSRFLKARDAFADPVDAYPYEL